MADLRWTESHARYGQGIESCVGSLARQVLLDAERYHIDLGLVKRQPHAKRRRTEGAVQPCTPTEGILAKILSAGCPEVVTDQQPGPGVVLQPFSYIAWDFFSHAANLGVDRSSCNNTGFHC